MEYPLNMQTDGECCRFALANDEAEHRALSDAGFLPAFQPVDDQGDTAQGHTVDTARATLDAAGVAYDKRFGLAKLVSLLPA